MHDSIVVHKFPIMESVIILTHYQATPIPATSIECSSETIGDLAPTAHIRASQEGSQVGQDRCVPVQPHSTNHVMCIHLGSVTLFRNFLTFVLGESD